MPIIRVAGDWYELPQRQDVEWLSQNLMLRGEELILADYFHTLRALLSAGI